MYLGKFRGESSWVRQVIAEGDVKDEAFNGTWKWISGHRLDFGGLNDYNSICFNCSKEVPLPTAT